MQIFVNILLTAHDFLCKPPCVSKRKKLLEKLASGNKDRAFTFGEAELLLLQAGFVKDGGEGSHRVYRHPDGRKMVLAYHGKEIKPVYIKQVRRLLN
jgi:predicted RNA binding protein YcfA (HicA-like mRNA interferase family)